jgi:IS1 family transposase
MNKVSVEKRSMILNMLCEGMSMRSISRTVGVSINTVSKLLVDAGAFCSQFHDDKVRGVRAERIQADEIWSFTYAKQKNTESAKAAPEDAGDTWTWTAIDPDTKLIVSWLVGGRGSEYALAFMNDLRDRLIGRIQLTTDGHTAYEDAVEVNFGADVDYAQMVKVYGELAKAEQRRYSPSEFVCATKRCVSGNPNMDKAVTSHVERLNLSLRMGMRRFTRLTNAFSKKFENHVHMVAIYTVFYNWIRIHRSLKVTPAMESGLTDQTMEWADILKAMDQAEAPKKRGPYKKRQISN